MPPFTHIPVQRRSRTAARTTRCVLALVTDLLLAVPAALAAASTARAATLSLGFLDQGSFMFGSPAANASWLSDARRLGAGFVRMNVQWSSVAPNRPPTAVQAEDPSWGGYDWTVVDNAVRAAHDRGFQILLTVVYALNGRREAAHRPAPKRARGDPIR